MGDFAFLIFEKRVDKMMADAFILYNHLFKAGSLSANRTSLPIYVEVIVHGVIIKGA